jgi:hypothetical protein
MRVIIESMCALIQSFDARINWISPLFNWNVPHINSIVDINSFIEIIISIKEMKKKFYDQFN